MRANVSLIFRLNYLLVLIIARVMSDMRDTGDAVKLVGKCQEKYSVDLACTYYNSSIVDDAVLELVFDIECRTSWEDALLPLCLCFLKALKKCVKKYELFTHHMPLLTIPARRTLRNFLTTTHELPKVHSLMWGNFINRGCLMTHWEVSYYSTKDNKDYVRSKDIVANFMHDENYMTLKFFSFESTKGFKEKGLNNEHKIYNVRLNYSSIARIIVDMTGKDYFASANEPVIRIHFVMTDPVIIRKKDLKKETSQRGGGDQDGDRYRCVQRGRTFFEFPQKDLCVQSMCNVFTITYLQSKNNVDLYELLCRVYHRSGAEISFGSITAVYGILSFTGDSDVLNYASIRDESVVKLVRSAFEFEPGTSSYVREARMFPLWFLLEGLLSRGAVFLDEVAITVQYLHDFLETVLTLWKRDRQRCEWALEDLLHSISDRKDAMPIKLLLINLYNKPNNAQRAILRQSMREGFVLVRKLVVTPTRRLYVAPEYMMGNRAIRNCGTLINDQDNPDKYLILRISFRDDDGSLMRASSTGKQLIRMTMVDFMVNGTMVGGVLFSYLGNSNSQMRDHGCYFYMGSSTDCLCLRSMFGKFEKLHVISKYIARLGQCFTQSVESKVKLFKSPMLCEYDRLHDVIGGSDSNQKEYTFSDGVGKASKDFFSRLSKDVFNSSNFVPAAIQFRFRGGKGVLSLDPNLDDILSFLKTLNLVNLATNKLHRDVRHAVNYVMFRDSQIKWSLSFVRALPRIRRFIAPKSSDGSAAFEVVKYSTPTAVALNRPFINILDQVTSLQSASTHRRVCDRIDELLDRHLKIVSQVLIDEKQCRNRLMELPHRLQIDKIPEGLGFRLSTEPFFRSLVKACVRFSIHKHLHKQQIQIPNTLGRSMFGIMDETGLLQYGQVYCSITTNIGIKMPSHHAKTQILKGPVLITKNPCIVAGDVRMFEAVDIPELHHLRDVLVFPMHGPRPHPDEMAGSDLDGDEYSVVWDKELFFDYNFPAMDFTSSASGKQIEDDPTPQMVGYYFDYVTQDQVGKVANAHLTTSDQFGINSRAAAAVARKHSQAVDFPKTGIAPAPLSEKWVELDDRQFIAPEKSCRQPDFMENKNVPVYRSDRMIGHIFRQINEIKDILQLSEERDAQQEIHLEPMFIVPGYEEYLLQAESEFTEYSAAIHRELDHLGIMTEAEVITGAVLEMKSRLSDKDRDDMSLFNAAYAMEQKVTQIWTHFRVRFFEGTNHDGTSFGSYDNLATLNDTPYANENNLLHYYCRAATAEMKKKASAYYYVAYSRASKTPPNQGRILSFPWLVWDVLVLVMRDGISSEHLGRLERNEFYERISKHIAQYCSEHAAEHAAFAMHLHALNSMRSKPPLWYEYILAHDGCGAFQIVADSTSTDHSSAHSRPGLMEVLFFLNQWADKAGILRSPLNGILLNALLILFGTWELRGSEPSKSAKLRVQTEASNERGKKLTSAGHLFVDFLQYCSTNVFRALPDINFTTLGIPVLLIDKEWLNLHRAARQTYFSVMFSSTFDELPLKSTSGDAPPVPFIVHECQPFMIELSTNVKVAEYEKLLIKRCGLADLRMRRVPGAVSASRVRVSALGNSQALRKLRHILTVKVVNNAEEIGPDSDLEYQRRTQQCFAKTDDADEVYYE